MKIMFLEFLTRSWGIFLMTDDIYKENWAQMSISEYLFIRVIVN